jgi:putative endonuclease
MASSSTAAAPKALTAFRLNLLQNSLHLTEKIARKFSRLPPLPPHLITGRIGETEALFFLRRHGYIVVARQWRSTMYPGDLDLIAWDGDCLCFIEVKTRGRRSPDFTAESAVDLKKREVLRRLARVYLRRMPEAPANMRFDILSVYLEPDTPPQFDHFPNAFGMTAPARPTARP